MNIVLMAGGGGTRLWPVSRRKNPKQFLKVEGDKTLLEKTYDRARYLVEDRDIFVATLEEYSPHVRSILTTIPTTNIFYEPSRRDTTAAFAAVAVRLKVLGRGDEPTMFFWSDHVFTAERDFMDDLQKVPELIERHPDHMVVLGHVPTSPETGFGYIEAGELIQGYEDVFAVKSFKEKPDVATANQFLAAGNFYWNIGSFSFLPNYFLQELRNYEPAFMQTLDQYEKAVKQGDDDMARSIYNELPKVSVEYTVMEKTPRVIVITGDYGWNDVGNWSAMHDVLGVSALEDIPRHHHVHVDSKDNFVYNTTQKIVSLIGMKDTIVVVTDEAVLVTNKKDAAKVKELVVRLEQEGREQYL